MPSRWPPADSTRPVRESNVKPRNAPGASVNVPATRGVLQIGHLVAACGGGFDPGCLALGADVGLSLTGVAGPTEQDGQPVGTVWIGLHTPAGGDESRLLRLAGERDQIRQIATISALDWLRRTLLGTSES